MLEFKIIYYLLPSIIIPSSFLFFYKNLESVATTSDVLNNLLINSPMTQIQSNYMSGIFYYVLILFSFYYSYN